MTIADGTSVRVVVVDDHEMVRESFVRLLAEEPGIVVVAAVGTAAGALESVVDTSPDVVVLDQVLPDGEGSAVASAIMARRPAARVLLITGSLDAATALDAVAAGCAGCLAKTAPGEELVRAVRTLASGGSVLPVDWLATVPRIDQLELVYQPIVELDGGDTVGFEALLRWNRPGVGLVLPATFLGQLDATDFMVEVGRWVISTACLDAARWPLTHDRRPAAVSVNLSAHELLADGLVEHIDQALRVSGLAPRALVIEATEHDLLVGTAATLARLDDIRKLGVRLALDDFGTGFSSMGYLLQFPVDFLKIDKSFVDAVPSAPRGITLIRSICRMAQNLDVTVLAEGIEHPEQTRVLRDLGCALGQGYVFSRPLPRAAVAPALAR